MQEDDFPLLLDADLKNGVKRFMERYKYAPVLFKRSPSITSLSSHCVHDNDGKANSMNMSGPVDEAMKVVTQIEQQMGRSSRRYWVPSAKDLCHLMISLSHATFLSSPTPTGVHHESKDNEMELMDLLYYHIPIHDIDDIIVTYLDSSMYCHG
jgi:hypothetical protein